MYYLCRSTHFSAKKKKKNSRDRANYFATRCAFWLIEITLCKCIIMHNRHHEVARYKCGGGTFVKVYNLVETCI